MDYHCSPITWKCEALCKWREHSITVHICKENFSMYDLNNANLAEIVLTQKSCIFMQTKCKKCIIKILMHPRTQDVDLKNSLHLLWILNRFCCLRDVKNFRTKWIHMVAAILDLTTQRGLETIYTSGKLEWAPAMFVVWLTVLVECPLTCTCNMMNREKGGRQSVFRQMAAWHWLPSSTKFLREFIFAGWRFFVLRELIFVIRRHWLFLLGINFWDF